jgi:transcriptional regulator with XRE-family HTH domain
VRNTLLRSARRERGWTQQQLADFAQLSLSTIERAERGESIRGDSIERICECLQKTPEQLGFIRHSSDILHDASHKLSLDDYLSTLESEMKLRWSLYHTGETNLAYQGLNFWIQRISECANLLRDTNLYERALTLLSIAYQLQGSVLRDKMLYHEAQLAHRKSFLIAKELFNPELIASALVREGITFNQQDRPKEAIACFMHALETIKHLGYVQLEAYTYQALSEAQAKAQLPKESWTSINLAEKSFEKQSSVQEQTLIRFSLSSLNAQKGVNSMILHQYQQALDQLDHSLEHYNPALLRGRARLLIQKAEAYYNLGSLDACVANTQEAFNLARSAGSNKIISRVKNLYMNLKESKWRKEQVVSHLDDVLAE